MKLRTPHFIGIGLLVVGIVAVLIVQLTGMGRGAPGLRGNLQVVQGVVGSEKVAFFEDPEVKQVFADHGFDVQVTKSGSFKMASLPGLIKNDFAFPASEIAAENISSTHGDQVLSTHKPFMSPLAIATFEPILQLLEQQGTASKDAQGRWSFDMASYLDLVRKDTRWKDLPGAESVYKSPRSIMITSTDIRSSNSASMYLSLASYVLNGNRVIGDRAQADKFLPELTYLFTAQGYAGASSTAPFDDYLSQGMGAVPMVFVYEGQFLEEELKPNSRIQDGMVLAYPDPNIFSQHTGVTFSENGEEVMRLLESDAKLAELLAAHGFRPTGEHASSFQEFLDRNDLQDKYPSTGSFVNLAQEPSYPMLDYMLNRIGEAYEGGGQQPSPTPDQPAPNEPAPDPTTDSSMPPSREP